MPASPLEVFEDNVADAQQLIALAAALANTRVRRMRRELRASVGEALGMTRRDQDALDCVESEDIFVVLKPGGRFTRGQLTEAEFRPLCARPSSRPPPRSRPTSPTRPASTLPEPSASARRG